MAKFLVIGKAIYPVAKDKRVIRHIMTADSLDKMVITVQNRMDMSYSWDIYDVIEGKKSCHK